MFTDFVKNNSAAEATQRDILARLWKRGDGYTSGNTGRETNKTYWIKQDAESFVLCEGEGLNKPMNEVNPLIALREGTTTNKDGEVVPVLRGNGFINGKATEVTVRVNTLEDKQTQVKKNEARAKETGKANLLSNIPDLYITIATFKLDGRVEKDKPKEEQGSTDMPF